GVIPCSANEFSDPLYWRNFFVRHEAPFEWYGSFNELGEALTKYLKISDAIFQIGCGNSELASQLHDCGYRNVTSIDTDEAVIKKQIKNNKGREGLKFLCEPVDVESESINVVLDKGTLDALLPTQCDEPQQAEVNRMFKEVDRILIPNGRYVVVSLAQDQVVKCFIRYFTERKLLDEISLVMCANDGMERYKIVIVDDPDAPKISEYSVFIVPTGRDNEWLFATKKGRAFLRSRCDVSRLAVVFLYRSQIYGDFPSIKSELDEFIAEFYPRPQTDLPMRVIEEGESAVNGSWAVEEVAIEGKFYRRLAFFASQNLMQTEVLLKGNEILSKIINLFLYRSTFRVAVLGLGGGALPSYLCRHLTNVKFLFLIFFIGSRGVDVRIENAIDFVKRHAYKKKSE
uniref:Methyltransf_11 domain-containing protein n=1 Tax=Syphacia muris TaxID=451379 RepID=A0A0N5A805_9BILA